ncbi:PREDICTED: cytochrome c biogenesis protein CCS1, chloroplastic-like isoform X2 [Ipomoea nil]|uniref:cytochrome c biogenesis protein CCS1, chloroplastic-like isoform X2 n=1 Tax=Ipomoea nil TaxID=35883 RepID=UPI000901C78C|nr:PREDICTED: cytochrome c biogenesis protein CCS1, chloroplastic-like isoform X2 [Ipomoea nil]
MGTVNISSKALRFPQELHHPEMPISFKSRIFPHTAKIHGVYNKKGKAFSFSLSCTLKTAKGKKGGKKKVVVPDSDRAPPLFEGKTFLNGQAPARRRPAVRRSNDGGVGLFGAFPKRVFAGLSNLPLAFAQMFSVAGLMALGTIIDQGEVPGFDIQKFQMFSSSPVFLGTLALLGASLMNCSDQSETPLVKVARRWSFLNSRKPISEQESAETLPKTSVEDLGITLMGTGYEVFLKGPLYAFKGLAGQIAPVVVNLALILVMMSGGTLGASVGDEHDPIAGLPTPSDYNQSGEVSQLLADPSSHDLKGKDPLRCSGIRIYKTDRCLPQPLKTNGDKTLVVTFVPVEDSNSSSNGNEDASSPDVKGVKEADLPNVKKTEDDADSPNAKGISMVATDSQSVTIYHKEGKVVGVGQHNSQLPIETDGTEIVIVDTIGSPGVDLETDDRAKIVYAGFGIGAVMLMNCINYLSNVEVWALQDGTTVIVGGKTNRAKGEFPDEIIRLLDQVPAEIFGSSSSSSTESDDLSD